MTSFSFNYLLKALCPNMSHWRLGLQHKNFGGHNSVHNRHPSISHYIMGVFGICCLGLWSLCHCFPSEGMYSKSCSMQVFRNMSFLDCPPDSYSAPRPFVTNPSVWVLLFFPHTPLGAFLLTQSYATHGHNIHRWAWEM